jgi:ADP-heptose:LPS heptosyltransferase
MREPLDGSGRHDGRPWLLVLRALGLGDYLTSLPALRALADAYPEHRRVLAVSRSLEPLVRVTSLAGEGGEGGEGEAIVDDVVPLGGLEPLPAWVPPLDVAVNLHGQGPDSHRILLAARPRRLIAYAHPDVPESAGGPVWEEDEHDAARWCRLLEENGIPASRDRLDLRLPPVPLPAPALGATIVHPGGKSEARRWPRERWAAVARHERLAGHRVFLTGSPDEVELAQWVASTAGLPSEALLAGQTDVVELAAVVAAAGLVISADTGVAHLATALRTPSVVLFGPASPAHWGPPPDRTIHKPLWAGWTGDPMADGPHPGLLAITVDQVLAAVDEVRAHPAVAAEPALAKRA